MDHLITNTLLRATSLGVFMTYHSERNESDATTPACIGMGKGSLEGRRGRRAGREGERETAELVSVYAS